MECHKTMAMAGSRPACGRFSTFQQGFAPGFTRALGSIKSMARFAPMGQFNSLFSGSNNRSTWRCWGLWGYGA